MKTRNGFVSNSSSSSFILKGKTRDIARHMLTVLMEDWKDWGYLNTHIDSMLNNLNQLSTDIPIMMPSCNYDTYIRDIGDGKVYVSTCHNHQWDFDAQDLGGEDVESVLETTSIDVCYYDLRDGSKHTKDIWLNGKDMSCPDCKNKLYSIFKTEDGYDKCPECLSEFGRPVVNNVLVHLMPKGCNVYS